MPVRESSIRRRRSWKTPITAAPTPSTSSTIARVTERRDGVPASGEGSQTFQTETQTSTAASGSSTSGAISAPTQWTAAVAVPLRLLIQCDSKPRIVPGTRGKEGRMVSRKLTLGQLASVGEGAIGRLAQNPVTHKALEGALQLKERVEKLINGLDSVEQRLTAVEKRLEALEKPKRRTPARKS